MKRQLLRLGFAIAVIMFAAAGCVLPFWSELYGTWTYSSGGDSVSLIFSFSKLTIEVSGTQNGTAVFSLWDVDEAAGHILATFASATGDLAPDAQIGYTYYMTYSISGDVMYFSGRFLDYPDSANGGPFIKE